MTNKVVMAPTNNTKGKQIVKKKKKNHCCTCLVTTLVIMVILSAAIVGGGWFFGDKYAKQYLGLSISDTFGAIGDILKEGNEKDVVSNAFAKEDEAAFIDELKTQLFIKKDVNIDIDKIIDNVLEMAVPTPKPAKAALNAGETGGTGDTGGAGGTGDTGGTGGTGDTGEAPKNNFLMDFLGEILVRENMDREALNHYTAENASEYNFHLSDKTLAAFLNHVILKYLDKSPDIKAQLSGYGIDDINKYLSLKQVVFGKETMQVSGAAVENVPNIKLTLGIKLEDVAKVAVPKLLPKNLSGFGGIINFFLGVLLPKNTFVSVKMGLEKGAETKIIYNNLNDAQHDRIFSAAQKVSGMDIKKTINDTVTQYVGAYLDVISEMGIFNEIKDGAISVDLFQLIIDAAGLNKDKPDDQLLSSGDVINTLAAVLGSEFALGYAGAKKYDFKYDYIDANGNIITYEHMDNNGNPVYTKPIEGLSKADYKNLLLHEVADSYLIDLNGEDKTAGTADDITFDSLMKMFGLGGGGTGGSGGTNDLMNLFNVKKIENILGKPADEITVKITDKMLGAVVDYELDNILASSSSLANYKLKAEAIAITLEKPTNGKIKHNYLQLYASIETAPLFEAMGEAGGLLKNLFEGKILLSIKIDITVDATLKAANEERTLGVISFNNVTPEKTRDLLGVIGKFGVAFSVDDILKQVEAPLNDVLNKMGEFIPGLEFAESQIVLPGLFDVMSDLVFTKTVTDSTGNVTKEKIVTGEEISDVLGSIVQSGKPEFIESYITNPSATDYKTFLNGQLKDKFYIADSIVLNNFDDVINTVVNTSTFDQKMFNISKMQHDARPASDLCPTVTDKELAVIIKETLNKNPGLEMFTNIMELTIDVGNSPSGTRYEKLVIKIKVNIADILGAENKKFMPVDEVFVKAEVDLGTPITDAGKKPRYPVSVLINDMTPTQFDTINKMINHFGSLDLAAKEVEIGEMVFEQFANIETSLGGAIEFVPHGIKMISFYDFLAKAINKKDVEGEKIKGAIQGLFEKQDANSSSYNFDRTRIINNPIATSASPNFKFTDKKFGAYLGKALETGSTPVNLIQATILANNRVRENDEWLNGFNVPLDKTKSYLALTFDVELGNIGGGVDISSFIPKDIFATAVISYDSKTEKFVFEFYRVNEMTLSTQEMLLSIVGENQAAITDVVNQTLAVLNRYITNFGTPSFNETANIADGIGEITFTPKFPPYPIP